MARTPGYDCIVIGGGPAGLNSALYLKRFRRNVLLVQHGLPRAAWIPKTKNLIGYDQGISGAGLLKRLRRQIAEVKVPTLTGEAVVTRAKGGFSVKVGKRLFHARKLILATGIRDSQPAIKGIGALRRAGLLRYCPICDGYEHKNKRLILLVSAGDCLGKIRFLGRYSSRLLVIGPEKDALNDRHRRRYRGHCVGYLSERLLSIRRSERGIVMKLGNGKTYYADAAYVELGFTVNDVAFRSLKGLKRAADGRLLTDRDQRTSVAGVFAAGDCTAALAQIAVAAGQAATAATAVHNELLGL